MLLVHLSTYCDFAWGEGGEDRRKGKKECTGSMGPALSAFALTFSHTHCCSTANETGVSVIIEITESDKQLTQGHSRQ